MLTGFAVYCITGFTKGKNLKQRCNELLLAGKIAKVSEQGCHCLNGTVVSFQETGPDVVDAKCGLSSSISDQSTIDIQPLINQCEKMRSFKPSAVSCTGDAAVCGGAKFTFSSYGFDTVGYLEKDCLKAIEDSETQKKVETEPFLDGTP